jgi:predicted kinase
MVAEDPRQSRMLQHLVAFLASTFLIKELPNCSSDCICVTSLNMRKWMRERLQRRKKKSDSEAVQPAPPPLQPAYFDGSEASTTTQSEPPAREGSPAQTELPEESPAENAMAESPEASRRPSGPKANAPQQRGRSRRRRGGRGRGGRERAQSVAQAFTPAAEKGVVPETPPEAALAEPVLEAAEETQPEIEPESEIAAPPPQAPPVPAAIPGAPARPPRGIVVLAIGLPGSGKSTWFKRHNVTPLSSDMLRSLLFDDIREQRFQDLVFSNLRSMLKARLIAKRPMNYVDATNLTPHERQHWIKLAKDYNYEVQAVFFDVPLEVCIERHQRRDRVVPEDIMRRMAAKLKPPSFDEGFAKITVVRVKKKG